MTLTLQFGPGVTIFVVGVPDDDNVAGAERIAYAVMESGYQPYPKMGRIAWDELVAAGLRHGVLVRTEEQGP